MQLSGQVQLAEMRCPTDALSKGCAAHLTALCIAIVAETCSPFTVLPGLMNEYRIPELNVQNGVLKRDGQGLRVRARAPPRRGKRHAPR